MVGTQIGNRSTRTGHRNRGISIIYMVIYMVAMTAFCSLAVDFGRVQMAKNELRGAADAAARAGAAGIPTDKATAIAYAQNFATKNKIDGQPLSISSSDITFYKWDLKSGTGQVTSDFTKVNAIGVKVRRSAAKGNAIPTMFAGLIGINSCDISAEAVAMVIPPVNVNQNVLATANPFLSGMPYGSQASGINPHNSPDYAGTASNPRQSPQAVTMSIVEGQSLTFDTISGTAGHDPNLPDFQPDGELADIGHNNLTTSQNGAYMAGYTNENGIADMKSPINALVGVFIDDNAPNQSGAAPANLDFSTDASRDFATLKPALKQIFFIGDGVNSAGNKQQFVVPKGATRLFLATWDFYEWNNNYGYRNVKVNRPMSIITVK